MASHEMISKTLTGEIDNNDTLEVKRNEDDGRVPLLSLFDNEEEYDDEPDLLKPPAINTWADEEPAKVRPQYLGFARLSCSYSVDA